jgi:membrane associated rhomboid family serine protease
VTSALVTATRSHIAPLRARVTSRGLAGAAPASLAIAVASLILTALVQVPSALHADATRWFEYRGDDLYAGELWRLVTSGLLAQSWLQYLWTLFIAVVGFAVLEVRVGPGRMLACVAASHVLPTVAVALLAPLLGRPDVLSEVDYGTSCLVVGAVAALAWLGRSALLAAFIVVGLAADVMLSAPVTAIEHAAAVVLGVLLVADLRVQRPALGLSLRGR